MLLLIGLFILLIFILGFVCGLTAYSDYIQPKFDYQINQLEEELQKITSEKEFKKNRMAAYQYITSTLKTIASKDPRFSGCIYELLNIVGEYLPENFEDIMEELDYWLEKYPEEKKKKGRPKKIKEGE